MAKNSPIPDERRSKTGPLPDSHFEKDIVGTYPGKWSDETMAEFDAETQRRKERIRREREKK